MKSLKATLKISIPLGLGIFLIWYMLQGLSPKEKEDLTNSLSQANYFYLVLSFLFGLLAHVSRAIRWGYMFESFGVKIKFWNSFHSVMAGYFINLLAPRAGEPARAGFLARNENVSFERSFGTIVAERVIDLLMLGSIFLVTIALQKDKLPAFQSLLDKAKDQVSPSSTHWFSYIFYVIVGALVLLLLYSLFNKNLRQKIIGIIKGIIEGLKTIFTLKKRWQFIGHTLFIWIMYVAMFGICFPSLDATSDLPISSVLAGFVAGATGIVLVQGGLGVYPILVSVALTLYLGPSVGKLLNLDGYALGWLIWIPQTILIILLGILSLISLQMQKKHV